MTNEALEEAEKKHAAHRRMMALVVVILTAHNVFTLVMKDRMRSTLLRTIDLLETSLKVSSDNTNEALDAARQWKHIAEITTCVPPGEP